MPGDAGVGGDPSALSILVTARTGDGQARGRSTRDVLSGAVRPRSARSVIATPPRARLRLAGYADGRHRQV
ncbi:hypothetical protein MILUP08_30093 [Micromonospora lupini str. Lupac 08]|uniref:Uncharacterized protein n=1 Tax=Micromonospora lupini str. Lupac 08 TaxID=1150864 RepID=I0LDB1_9ACTN|nr:hypothetical protein MILUP08_30093 [Micromonospora lupini str. Lupac 08]